MIISAFARDSTFCGCYVKIKMNDHPATADPTLYQQIMDAIERLRRERDKIELRLDENLMRLVYQVAIADQYDPAVSSGLIRFSVRFEVEMALLFCAEFLQTGEMLPADARYVYKNIDDCRKEGRLVSSDAFRPTNTREADLGDYWIHRLQVRHTPPFLSPAHGCRQGECCVLSW